MLLLAKLRVETGGSNPTVNCGIVPPAAEFPGLLLVEHAASAQLASTAPTADKETILEERLLDVGSIARTLSDVSRSAGCS